MQKQAKDIKVGDNIYIDIGYHGHYSFEVFAKVTLIQETLGLFDSENTYLNFHWKYGNEDGCAGPYGKEDLIIVEK